MSVIIFAVITSFCTGLSAAEIILTAVTAKKGMHFKKSIKIKGAGSLFVSSVSMWYFVIQVLLAVFSLYFFDYRLTEKIFYVSKTVFSGSFVLIILFGRILGSGAYITENGIVTRTAFYPKGKARYKIEKTDKETFVSLYTKRKQYDAAFIVKPKNERSVTAAVKKLYQEYDGTSSELQRQSYIKRNLIIFLCSAFVFTGGFFAWYAIKKPVICVGDRILKTDSEYALFSHSGYLYQLNRGSLYYAYAEFAEKEEEIFNSVDYTEKLTPEDMSALKEMPNLKHLDVTLNNIDDLTEIGRLTQLEGLAFGGGALIAKPNDYSPLKNLTNLKYFCGLGLDNLHDASVFENMDKLVYFELTSADIQTGLSEVCENDALLCLNLFLCTADDFSPIGKCVNLRSLTISDTNAADLGFLADLAELEYLAIENISAEDYSVLLEMPSLKELKAKNCDIPKEICSELITNGVEIKR